MTSGCVLFMMWLKTFPTRPTSKFLFCHRVFYLSLSRRHTPCVFLRRACGLSAVSFLFSLIIELLMFTLGTLVALIMCHEFQTWLICFCLIVVSSCQCIVFGTGDIYSSEVFFCSCFYLGSMNGWEYALRGQEAKKFFSYPAATVLG